MVREFDRLSSGSDGEGERSLGMTSAFSALSQPFSVVPMVSGGGLDSSIGSERCTRKVSKESRSNCTRRNGYAVVKCAREKEGLL